MGDHGRTYSSITETHVQKMKELLPLADIITPNITESCLLTGTPWKDGEWTLQELSGLCERLADICQTASITSDEASTGTTASGSDGSSVGAVSNGSAGASIVITGIDVYKRQDQHRNYRCQRHRCCDLCFRILSGTSSGTE